MLRRARVVPDLGSSEVRDDAGIVLETGRVALLGETAEADRWTAAHGELSPEVLDLAGRVVLPGLVNAHTHLYSTLARGMPLLPGREAPADFLAILEEIWWPLDRALDAEDVYLSALLGLAECARAGVTTVVDHHASERAVEGSLDLVARAAREVGVRVATCFEVTDRDGPEVARAGIAENVRFAKAAREAEKLGGSAHVAATFGLHASLTLSDETLERARDAARGAGLPGFHVHVAESRFDPDDSLRRSGVRTVQRLARAGVLGPASIAAHGVHVDAAERALLKETGTVVVTNPSSNRNNAVGRADLARLLESGVKLALGTDGMSADVLAETTQAFLGSKDRAESPRAGWAEAHAALAGNAGVAQLLFQEAKLGKIAQGGPADLVVLDYVPWTPLQGERFFAHVLYGNLGARTWHTIAGGRFVVRDGRLASPGVDLERAAALARERARALWDRRAAFAPAPGQGRNA
ncbi:amidohydrolase family protein [bacterium]|nr:amidohydrolase family protein [bacterium]